MLQAEPHQRQLTGGTGWLQTSRYSNSVSSNIAQGKYSPMCFGGGDTDSIFFIGLGTRLLQIYEVVEFFFL